jgi:hypothetical protein
MVSLSSIDILGLPSYRSSDIIDEAHRIDPTTTEGLLNLVALGNLLEICWIYDPRTYVPKNSKKTVPAIEIAQRSAIRRAYHDFQQSFAERQHLKMDGKLVDPMTMFFKVSILHLTVSICKYKEIEPEANRAFSPEQLRSNAISHFYMRHPSLVKLLKQELAKPVELLPYCKTFDWSGPNFEVVDARLDCDNDGHDFVAGSSA